MNVHFKKWFCGFIKCWNITYLLSIITGNYYMLVSQTLWQDLIHMLIVFHSNPPFTHGETRLTGLRNFSYRSYLFISAPQGYCEDCEVMSIKQLASVLQWHFVNHSSYYQCPLKIMFTLMSVMQFWHPPCDSHSPPASHHRPLRIPPNLWPRCRLASSFFLSPLPVFAGHFYVF